MKLNTFQLQASKVKPEKFNLRVGNSKWKFSFFDTELVTRNVTFYFRLRVTNSKGNSLFFSFKLVTRKWKNKS